MTTPLHTNLTHLPEGPLEERLRSDAPAWRAAAARDETAAARTRACVLAAVHGERALPAATTRLRPATRWALAAAASLLALVGLRAVLDRGPASPDPLSTGDMVATESFAGTDAIASATDVPSSDDRPRFEFLLAPLKPLKLGQSNPSGRGAALPFDAALLAESRALAMDASRVTSSMVGSLPDPLRRIFSK